MDRRTFIASAAGAAAALLPSAAKAFPERQLRIIVPNAAGGGTDINARLIARTLEKITKQTLPVMNVVGGGTSIGARQVRDSAPDGHTILFIHHALLAASAMGVADFPPMALDVVAQTGEENYVMMVGRESTLRNFSDAVEAARKAPDTLRFGVQIGALNHFTALRLANQFDVRFRYVNTGGGGPTRNALLGNHLDIAFATVGEVGSFVKSGELRLLTIFSGERVAAFPDLTTAAEQGFPIELALKYWWWLPKGVPEDRRQYWTGHLAQAFKDEELLQRFRSLEIAPKVVVGAAAAEEVASQFAEMERLAKTFGLR
jgi:tripartite-type tricarboxylate transporter receptor subunit TctC